MKVRSGKGKVRLRLGHVKAKLGQVRIRTGEGQVSGHVMVRSGCVDIGFYPLSKEEKSVSNVMSLLGRKLKRKYYKTIEIYFSAKLIHLD